MTAWFLRLTLRERVMIAAVLPLALILLGYQFGWRPVQDRRAAATLAIADYARVEAAAGSAARGEIAPATPADPTPVATRVTRSAEASGVPVRRLEPEGEALRVSLGDVGYAQVILWIAELEAAESLRVVAIEMDRRTAPGIVSTRLLLERME